MNHIYNRLNRLSKNQLLEICKILKISCSKKKRYIILKLLQPIHTYRMERKAERKAERAAKRKERAEERQKKSRELKLLREQKRAEKKAERVEKKTERDKERAEEKKRAEEKWKKFEILYRKKLEKDETVNNADIPFILHQKKIEWLLKNFKLRV